MIQVSILLSIILLQFKIVECRSSFKVPGIEEKQKRSGFIDGDFIIGALFPVHQQPLLKGKGNPLMCGDIREFYGIQRVEAAFFAIDAINNDKTILPNIKLGINIRDECSSESITQLQTLKLILEPVVVPVNEDEKKLVEARSEVKKDHAPPLIGVIGPSTTSTTIIVRNLLKSFEIPQIGYSATGYKLRENLINNYLLRMVPSDFYQMYFIFKLLRKFNWTYISVVYTSGEYAHAGETLLQQECTEKFNVCIANNFELSNYNNESEYDHVLKQLISKVEKAKVVICFCEGEAIKNFLNAIKRNNATGKFLLIGSDAWGSRHKIVQDYEEQAVGSLTLQIKPTVVEKFDEYYLKKNLTNNKRNPWFEEFWQYKFKCSLDSTSNANLTPCTGEEDLGQHHKQDSKLFYIIKSIWTLAYGLHNMNTDVCGNETYCDQFYPFDTSNFMEYLKKTNFAYQNESVNFTSTGGPWRVSYNIFNFQKMENGTYEYVKIGEYDGNSDELGNPWYEEDFFESLNLNEAEIQYPGGRVEPVKSVCSDPCPVGQIQNISTCGSPKCCWLCSQCDLGKIKFNDTYCKECPLGKWPNKNQTNCVEGLLIYTQWLDIQSVISLIISFMGISLTITAATIFIKHKETPVVKSSTRELCYIMLVGMIAVHCISFGVIAKPSLISCTFVRTIPAISFTIIYAALLVKTHRIARILAISKKKFPNLNPRFMSLNAQITITSVLIGIETAVCWVMLIKEPPWPEENSQVSENQLFISLTCPISSQAILIPFSFVAFLIFMCTLYAIKTRNLPDNFNEAKFIGFSMYATCITWVAFGLIYYGSDLRVITTCACASANALVTLIFLFFPKLYIILWKPEKNTRVNFTTSKGIRCIIGRDDSSKSMNRQNSMETNFKYIPDFNDQKRKSLSNQLKLK